jgi:hypothetical protein
MVETVSWRPTSYEEYRSAAEWCAERFGEYGESWDYFPNDSYLVNGAHYFPFCWRFLDLESAMMFRMVWG